MKNSKFQSLTIFVLANTETTLLKQTLDILINDCATEDIEKIVIVLKNKTCPSASEAQLFISENPTAKIEIYIQKSHSLEGCIGELPLLVKSSHFLIMASDMETAPTSVVDLLRKSKENPDAIVCASKWHKKSHVEGYGKIHEIGSRIMNGVVSLIFNKNLTDPFSVFQIYPLSIYKKMLFDHSLPVKTAYEYSLKALRCGFDYIEIPTVYKKRSEGKSAIKPLKLCSIAIIFMFTAIRLKFTKKNNLLK